MSLKRVLDSVFRFFDGNLFFSDVLVYVLSKQGPTAMVWKSSKNDDIDLKINFWLLFYSL